MRRLGQVAGLDGLRGVAVLLVVGCHAVGIAGGFLGVEIFFVLSGFLITTLLLDEHRETGRVSLRSFYIRRVRRLYPALAVVLAVWLLLAGAGLTPRAFSHEVVGVLVSGTYVANIASGWFYALPAGLRHLWSLALEEQFYVLWPPLLVLLLRRRIPARALCLALVGVAATVMALRAGLALGGAGQLVLYESPLTASGGLVLGCALAALRLAAGGRLAARSRELAAAGLGSFVFLLGIGLLGPGFDDRRYYSWLMVPVDLAAAATVLAVVVIPGSPVARMLSARWLRWCGRISYSLYLIHPVILVELVTDHVLLTPFEAIAASFVASAAIHRYVEKPLRARRVRPVTDVREGRARTPVTEAAL